MRFPCLAAPLVLGATLVLAGVPTVASSPPAAPPAARGGKPAGKAAVSARAVVRSLLRPINFPGVEQDKSTTLEDVLEKLRKDHGLAYTINKRAFEHEGLNAPPVEYTPVVEAKDLRPMRSTLARVLQAVLDRIPVPSGATFLVRDGGVEITTNTFGEVDVAPIGSLVGVIVAVDREDDGPPSPGGLTLRCTRPTPEANPAVQAACVRLQQQILQRRQALPASMPAQREQLLAQIHRDALELRWHQANLSRVKQTQHTIRVRLAAAVKVRATQPRQEFDDKGQARKWTKEELKEMRGDAGLPGFPAHPDDITPGRPALVLLARPWGRPKHPTYNEPLMTWQGGLILRPAARPKRPTDNELIVTLILLDGAPMDRGER
jgi:hypothetical protein